LALRYGADLSAREIGRILGLKTNAVEVALHRTLTRVRSDLQEEPQDERSGLAEPSPRIAP
jgi:DNA-directed RNA polymerase specialized sigma24 family protein